MRDKIADKIIDRRVEELLDPNLKWNHNGAGGTQQTVVGNETAIRQQNQNIKPQSAPQQSPAVSSNPQVATTRPSDGAVIIRSADEFRKLLTSSATLVAERKGKLEAWKEARDASRNGIGEADVKRQEQLLASAESDQKFAEKEYQTQIQLLKSEVETVHLVVETAEQTLARTQQLYESKVASSHEVDKHKRELTEAMQRLDRVKLLLSLYLEAEA